MLCVCLIEASENDLIKFFSNGLIFVVNTIKGFNCVCDIVWAAAAAHSVIQSHSLAELIVSLC